MHPHGAPPPPPTTTAATVRINRERFDFLIFKRKKIVWVRFSFLFLLALFMINKKKKCNTGPKYSHFRHVESFETFLFGFRAFLAK
jgi:hypothetical protein